MPLPGVGLVEQDLLELCELPGAIKLKNLQKKPKPGPRAIPTDDAIIKLVDAVRGERYGWCIAAMATFGCRTGEVPCDHSGALQEGPWMYNRL